MASLIDNGCAFGPRKASKVETPSSKGVSSLHRWSLTLMLLPVLWLMPLRSCTHVSVSTQLCVAAIRILLPYVYCCHTYTAIRILLLLPGAGTHDALRRTSRPQCVSYYILTSLNERTNRIGDLTRHRVS